MSVSCSNSHSRECLLESYRRKNLIIMRHMEWNMMMMRKCNKMKSRKKGRRERRNVCSSWKDEHECEMFNIKLIINMFMFMRFIRANLLDVEFWLWQNCWINSKLCWILNYFKFGSYFKQGTWRFLIYFKFYWNL